MTIALAKGINRIPLLPPTATHPTSPHPTPLHPNKVRKQLREGGRMCLVVRDVATPDEISVYLDLKQHPYTLGLLPATKAPRMYPVQSKIVAFPPFGAGLSSMDQDSLLTSIVVCKRFQRVLSKKSNNLYCISSPSTIFLTILNNIFHFE